MSRRIDITGNKYGRLTVIEMLPVINKKSKWKCRCDCGNITIVNYQHLKDNMTKSCGCYGKEVSAKNGKMSGHKISGVKSYLYKPSLEYKDRLKKRNFVELRQWKKMVLLKYNYVCDLCRGKANCAHHLNSWVSHPDQRFNIDNGIALCVTCHKKFHYHLGTRVLCTKKDYINFKRSLEEGGGRNEGFVVLGKRN